MPSLFSTADLQRLGDWYGKALLTDTCDILRESSTPKASGGRTITFPVQYSGVSCAVIDAGSPSEQVLASQVVGSVPKVMLLPRGQDVLATDRIKVNGTTTYHIVDLKDPDTFEVLREVLVTRLSIT